MHKSAHNIFDTFIFDRKKYASLKASKKDLKTLNIMYYDKIEAILNEEKKSEEPDAVFANFGIIEKVYSL